MEDKQDTIEILIAIVGTFGSLFVFAWVINKLAKWLDNKLWPGRKEDDTMKS